MSVSKARLVPGLLLLLLTGRLSSAQVWENRNALLIDPLGPQAGAEFGYALAAGDLDGDGFADLAVGAPFRDVAAPGGPFVDGGSVVFFRGGPTGLSFWNASNLVLEGDDWYGFSLLAADLDGDGRDEIAAGMPGMSAPAAGGGRIAGVGAVVYFDYDPDAGDFLEAEVTDYASVTVGASEQFDHFGWSLAAGDFDGDGLEELAVGGPFENRESPTPLADAGEVAVFSSSSLGPILGSQMLWTADAGGLDGSQADGEFGHALAAIDVDHDGRADLAIGEPGRVLAGLVHAGQVRVLHGSPSGLTAAATERIDAATIGGARQGSEDFGFSLAAGDFDDPGLFLCLFGACFGDLAIGAPGYVAHPGGIPVAGAGRVVTLLGSASGLDPGSAATFTADSFPGTSPAAADRFGEKLAAGELDARLGADLVIGSPWKDLGLTDRGIVDLAFGGAGGPASGGTQFVDERPGFACAPGRAGDDFGWGIAVGDFDGDGQGDLAVGVLGYPAAGQAGAGAVQILFGALFADSFERGTTGAWSTHLP